MIHQILNLHLPPCATVWIFGSRAKKALKKFSDLDLAVYAKSKLDFSILASLQHDFSESDLPYKVDIIDLNNIEENFRDKIKSDLVFFFEKKGE
jgi:type I restriction enzyme S subunit